MLRTLSRPVVSNSRQFAAAAARVQTSQTLDVPQPELDQGADKAAAPESAGAQLENGIQVAAQDAFGPVSSLSFAVNASARFETAETLGNSHFLRQFGFRGVKGRTHLRFVRELDNHGANLHISANREQIFYTVDFLRGDLPLVTELISGIFAAAEFPLHEVEDVRKHVDVDLVRFSESHDARILELLHKAAFRNGPLGNSLYVPQVNLDSVDSESLTGYAAKHFVGGNIAVAGSNVNLGDLQHLLAGSLRSVPSGKVAFPASKYYGSEVFTGRFDGNSRAAVAFKSEASPQVRAVLQHILGGSPQVPFGAGSSLLAKAAGSKVSAESFSFGYSDSALVGFLLKAPHGAGIQKSFDQAHEQIKKLATSVSDEDLIRGKNQAKFEYASTADKRSQSTESVARQLLSGSVVTPAAFAASVDAVTASDVQKAASALLQNKSTVVVAADDF